MSIRKLLKLYNGNKEDVVVQIHDVSENKASYLGTITNVLEHQFLMPINLSLPIIGWEITKSKDGFLIEVYI